jgi:hypothetical protein
MDAFPFHSLPTKLHFSETLVEPDNHSPMRGISLMAGIPSSLLPGENLSVIALD